MQYEIKQNEVLSVKTISTKKQLAVTIKTHHCPLYRVDIDAPDTLHVNEVGTVTLRWMKFNIQLGFYFEDKEKTDTITVTVEDATADFVPTAGATTITIASEEVGNLLIRAAGTTKEVIIVE